MMRAFQHQESRSEVLRDFWHDSRAVAIALAFVLQLALMLATLIVTLSMHHG